MSDLRERVARIWLDDPDVSADDTDLQHAALIIELVRAEVEREIAARLQEIAQEWDDRPNPNEASPLLRFAAELEKRNG